MKTITINRIELWPVFKLTFLIGLIIALVYNVVHVILIKIQTASMTNNSEIISTYVYKTGGCLSSVVWYLIYVLAISLIVTSIALLYNIFSRFIGGVRVAVEDDKKI